MRKGFRRTLTRSGSSKSSRTHSSRSRSHSTSRYMSRRHGRDRYGRKNMRNSRERIGRNYDGRRNFGNSLKIDSRTLQLAVQLLQAERKGRHRDRSRRSRERAGSSRHSILSFREFVVMQDREISAENLILEYQLYRDKLFKKIEEEFFEEHKDQMIIHDRYHPVSMSKAFDVQIKRSRILARQFIDQIKSNYHKNLRLCISDKILCDTDCNIPGIGEDVQMSTASSQWQRTICIKIDANGVPTQPLFVRHPGFQSLVVRDIPGHVSQWMIHDAIQDTPGYIGTFMAGGVGETPRTALISFKTGQERDSAKAELNRIKTSVGNPGWILEFADPFISPNGLVRVCPPVAALSSRIVMDIEQTASIIQYLDSAYSVWKNNIQSDASENNQMNDDHMEDVSNPLLSPDIDIEFTAEGRLDLHLTYLRIVHNVCYYSGAIYSDPLRLWEIGGPCWVRPCQPFESSVNVCEEQSKFVDGIDNYWRKLLATEFRKPSTLEELAKDRWNAYCEQHTLCVETNRYRCNLCRKLFQAPSYVHKHIHNRHVEALDEVTQGVVAEAIAESYMNDPNKILPPINDPNLKDSHDSNDDRECSRLRSHVPLSRTSVDPYPIYTHGQPNWHPQHYDIQRVHQQPIIPPYHPSIPQHCIPDVYHHHRDISTRPREGPFIISPLPAMRPAPYIDRDAPGKAIYRANMRPKGEKTDLASKPEQDPCPVRPVVSYEGL